MPIVNLNVYLTIHYSFIYRKYKYKYNVAIQIAVFFSFKQFLHPVEFIMMKGDTIFYIVFRGFLGKLVK